ncbi:hypothetical protein BGW36DRAFT_377019 [Talaromyces proteolyticus]|uniref:Uncharacterized protein n=1 Tax=Talaromyces proteolyticus TaxID=1131652 RepID=A0AAD4Q1V5_9EURO|nr:uncharacterized protein BGW36DRAFT_377019 [Talaromyces proteolyticus]KAH8698953.1 hypothetical protein BGW36DRAFT_377019 [Talaromyces proteolyticus]
MPFTSYISSSATCSASFTGSNGKTQSWGYRSAQQAHRDAQGNTYERSLEQNLGEDPVYEERQYDSQGRQLVDDGRQHDLRHPQGRIEDVSEKK